MGIEDKKARNGWGYGLWKAYQVRAMNRNQSKGERKKKRKPQRFADLT